MRILEFKAQKVNIFKEQVTSESTYVLWKFVSLRLDKLVSKFLITFQIFKKYFQV